MKYLQRQVIKHSDRSSLKMLIQENHSILKKCSNSVDTLICSNIFIIFWNVERFCSDQDKWFVDIALFQFIIEMF